MTGILIAMALVSIFAECFKLLNLDIVLKHHDLQTRVCNLEESDAKTLLLHEINNKRFQNPILLTTLVTDVVYSVFTVVLLLTNRWYVGMILILMTFIQSRFFKYQKSTVIIDSCMCIILLILYIAFL